MSDPLAIAFQLPQGLLDPDGRLHRQGELRLATGADELYISRLPRVRANAEFATLAMLARTVRRLGDLTAPSPEQLGDLFLADFRYLAALFDRCNPPAARRLGEGAATP